MSRFNPALSVRLTVARDGAAARAGGLGMTITSTTITTLMAGTG